MDRQRYQALTKKLSGTLTDSEKNVRYATERFLARLQQSPYKDNFILKGGFVLGSMYQIDKRTTQDLDTLLRNVSNDLTVVQPILESILSIDLKDNIYMELISIKQSLLFKEYPGFKACIQMSFLDSKTYFRFFLDMGLRDSVTPEPRIQEIPIIFNIHKGETESLELYAYPKETILAEKTETIISLGIQTSRMKDFYDIYLLLSDQTLPSIDKLYEAMNNTWLFRQKELLSDSFFENALFIINRIRTDKQIQKTNWPNYTAKHDYAKDLLLLDILEMLTSHIDNLKEEHQKRTRRK